jgi:hypothetical protein
MPVYGIPVDRHFLRGGGILGIFGDFLGAFWQKIEKNYNLIFLFSFTWQPNPTRPFAKYENI